MDVGFSLICMKMREAIFYSNGNALWSHKEPCNGLLQLASVRLVPAE